MNNWYFDSAKKYFDLKMYTVADVRLFVEADRITKEQFKKITNEPYDVSLLPIKVNTEKVM